MKTLDFSLEEIEIKFQGNSYKVRFPTPDELISLSENLKKIQEDDVKSLLEAQRSFIVDLGLPLDVLKKLNIKQTKQIIKELQEGN